MPETKNPPQQSTQQRGVSRRSSEPFFSSLAPSDFFSMNPFALMRRMQEEMERAFASGGQQGSRAWTPAIEVSERDGNYVVCAELPGLRPDDVTVEVTDHALVIEGERRQEQEQNEGGVHRTERSYGRFYRAVPLPEGVNGEQAQANFKDGVLEVKIPMPQQQEQRRRIPIQGGSQQGATTARPPSGPGSGQGNQALREGKIPGGGQQ